MHAYEIQYTSEVKSTLDKLQLEMLTPVSRYFRSLRHCRDFDYRNFSVVFKSREPIPVGDFSPSASLQIIIANNS